MDSIIRATANDAMVRVFAAMTTDLVEEARQRHNTSPVATAALGRLLTAGAMMGWMNKGDKDILTLLIKGEGPINGITVTADSHGTVKGYVNNPNVIIPAKSNGKLDVSGSIMPGTLDVIMDLGLKEPYASHIDLVSGEIAEDLTYYYASSCQIPSSVGLGVLLNKENTIRCAGGFIIQLMPFATEECISKIEKNLANIPSVTQILKEADTPKALIDILCEGMDVEINDTITPRFKCDCSKERVTKALVSIGKAEINRMMEEENGAELVCQFCNTKYRFTEAELRQIRDSL
ncbi:MAG: Hsp33 family molecular chaperone HslO [Lachnospiraceae bacterium]|nr:Hsp33 family molecular chaperone HslO [Lachnospiraceae bacterium]